VSHPGYFAFHCLQKVCAVGGIVTHSHSPRVDIIRAIGSWSLTSLFSTNMAISETKHQSFNDCLEDKRENYKNCSVLCCIRQCAELYAHAHTHTHTHTHMSSFLKMSVRLFRFNILCVSSLA